MKLIVNKEKNNITILSFIKKSCSKNISISTLHKLFRLKKILVNDIPIRFHLFKVKTDDVVIIKDSRVQIKEIETKKPEKQNCLFEVIYEDDNILIAFKENKVDISIFNEAFKYYFWQKYIDEYEQLINSNFAFVAAHRIDKLTSGLVIFPKNHTSQKALYNAFKKEGCINKFYIAECSTTKKKSIFLPKIIQGYIRKDEKQQKMIFIDKKRMNDVSIGGGTKSKFCQMEILKSEVYFFKQIRIKKITIKLITGRKHQIRAILSHYGFPILGDKKYNSKFFLENKIHLFSFKIQFNNMTKSLEYLNSLTIEKKL